VAQRADVPELKCDDDDPRNVVRDQEHGPRSQRRADNLQFDTELLQPRPRARSFNCAIFSVGVLVSAVQTKGQDTRPALSRFSQGAPERPARHRRIRVAAFAGSH
jgi:hypothetical protein